MKKVFAYVIFAVISGLVPQLASAQNPGEYDVFNPIAKYIKMGDAEKLSAWFADNLEVSVLSSSNDVSRNQARQIVKSFFNSHTPRDFVITHKAGQGDMKYALGNLKAGGDVYGVTIFISRRDNNYYIQQLKFEKND